MIDKEIIKIASNTENHGVLDKHTHFSKLKNSICGDNMKIYMIVKNDRVSNEFYVCPVYNYSIMNNQKIGIYNIEYEQMHGIGTPEDLEIYVNLIGAQ